MEKLKLKQVLKLGEGGMVDTGKVRCIKTFFLTQYAFPRRSMETSKTLVIPAYAGIQVVLVGGAVDKLPDSG